MTAADVARHPFHERPHKTLWVLTLPVLVSLIAEPLTGLVDTAFVARLGSAPLAALGIGTTLLSGVFWAFNFLGIGTQTEVGSALGAGVRSRATRSASLAITLATGLGFGLSVLTWPFTGPSARLMGASLETEALATTYMQIRLLGAPAILITMAAFGALRGLQDMRTPLRLALLMNGLNLVLDPILIFGAGPVPALGVAGAAWATSASQWLGALLAVRAVRAVLGFSGAGDWREARKLLATGRDLFIRTGTLLLFLVLATRSANRLGTEAGAAHQAIRQMWTFTAFLLDAYASSTQSLVSYFRAAARNDAALRVAQVATSWSLASGCGVAAAMLWGEDAVAALLVPAEARLAFGGAWFYAAIFQPINSMSFVSDGIHWGTGDYRYLRNAMLAATGVGATMLAAADRAGASSLAQVWLIAGVWISIRALFGALRVWPGIGAAPLREPAVATRPAA